MSAIESGRPSDYMLIHLIKIDGGWDSTSNIKLGAYILFRDVDVKRLNDNRVAT